MSSAIDSSAGPHTQERLGFGTVGWNVPHVFPAGDLGVARLQLSHLVGAAADGADRGVASGPLEAFQFMVGQCFYGGRVTDAWDRRALGALLAELVSRSLPCVCVCGERERARSSSRRTVGWG